VHGAGQVIGQNNPGVLHLQFSVQMPKNCVHALLGIVSHEEPPYEAASAVKELVKEEMVCVVFFSLFPKPQGAVSGIKCLINCIRRPELCELLVGLCAVGE
jgi:hypothetical protein